MVGYYEGNSRQCKTLLPIRRVREGSRPSQGREGSISEAARRARDVSTFSVLGTQTVDPWTGGEKSWEIGMKQTNVRIDQQRNDRRPQMSRKFLRLGDRVYHLVPGCCYKLSLPGYGIHFLRTCYASVSR